MNSHLNHFSIFYQSSEALWQDGLALQKKYLLKNYNWQYICDEHSVEEIIEHLQLKKHPGKYKVDASSEYLFRSQLINLSDIEKSFIAHLKNQNKKNKLPTLILIEMTWVIRSPSSAIYVKEFYAMLLALKEKHNFSICFLYNCNILLDEQLLMGLKAHPFIWANNQLVKNHYYVPINALVKRDDRAQFNYWISNLNPNFTTQKSKVRSNISGAIQPIYNLNSAPKTAVAYNSEEGRWKIRCLGKLKVYREYGELIKWNTTHGSTRKIKTIFAYLLYKGEKGASAEELADMLWPDDDIEVSMNRLYHNIRFLKLALSPQLKDNKESSPFIIREEKHYHLALPPNSWIDLSMFQELCFRGNVHYKNGNYKEALICYQSAERLYLGELLQDIPNKYIDNMEHDWCYSRRQWYKEMHQKLLLESATIYRSLSNITDALACCDRALAIAPYSENANIEKLLVFHEANRKDAFKRQFEVYSKTLKKFDMGEPSSNIRNIYYNYLNKF
ncbi:MAG: BTAD domain-containing putative transcriptional regulator [Chitinophagales bacterium]